MRPGDWDGCEMDRFTGFIDFSASPFALGDILTWNVRVCCEALSAGRKAVDVVALTDRELLGNAYQSFLTRHNLLCTYLDLAAAFYVNPLLRGFTHLMDRASFERRMRAAASDNQPMFPGTREYEAGLRTRNALYSSHLPMNRFYREHGHLPRLKVPQAYLAQAENFLESCGPEAFAVVVHVRRRVGEAHALFGGTLERDGDFGVWEAFFAEARRSHPETVFVILGKGVEWSRRLMRDQKLVFPKCLGLGLLDELAMIQAADLFMGLLSGPSTMAIFSEAPYALFVQQNYAKITAEVVGVEQGAACLPFACAHQTLVWKPPTLENLLAAFEEKYAALHGDNASLRVVGRGALDV